MNYSLIQIDLNQMSLNMTLLLIAFFLAIIVILIFILLKRGDILDVIKKDKSNKEDFIDRFANLSDEQIDFYFKFGQKQLEDIFKLRNNENASLLGHAATAAGAFSLFFIIGKWALHHHSDLTILIPLIVFLSYALLNMGLSIFSMFQAYRLPYTLPAQIYEIPKEYTNTDVRSLKEIFLERLVSDAKINAQSNERKMILLNHSRTFLLHGLISLGVAFVWICGKLYLSFIIS